MAYRGKNERQASSSGVFKTVLLGILLAAIFAGGVYEFRRLANKPTSVILANAAAANALPPRPIVLPNLSTTLADVEGGQSHGTATRGGQNGGVQINLTATLPPIDPTVSYTAWLQSQLPFDYIGLGELVQDPKNTADFTLDWQGPTGKDYATYDIIIITRQPKIGDTVPGAHVLEGTFHS